MKTHRIILDTDLAMGAPGSDIDDGFALALAVADPNIELVAVTTVAGNTDIASASFLSEQLLRKLKVDVPIYVGAAGPLLDPGRPRESAKGQSALEVTQRLRRGPSAAVAMVELVNAAVGELTIVTIGPLTNLAVALQIDPNLPQKVAGIWCMGGYFSGSQWNLQVPGEFNIWADPEAAQVVLNSGAMPHMVGLDVTYRVRMDSEQVQELANADSEFARYAGECGLQWIDVLRERYPRSKTHGSFHLHDPLTVAALSDPTLIRWSEAFVEVALSSVARGITVADKTGPEGGPRPNCVIADEVDSERFVAGLIGAILSLR